MSDSTLIKARWCNGSLYIDVRSRFFKSFFYEKERSALPELLSLSNRYMRGAWRHENKGLFSKQVTATNASFNMTSRREGMQILRDTAMFWGLPDARVLTNYNKLCVIYNLCHLILRLSRTLTRTTISNSQWPRITKTKYLTSTSRDDFTILAGQSGSTMYID